jgi:general stress protein 26
MAARRRRTARRPDDIEELKRTLRQFEVCVVVAASARGVMEARPVRIARVDPEAGILWFIVSATSELAQELTGAREITATMQASSRYLCLRGRAELLDSTPHEHAWEPWLAEEEQRLSEGIVVRLSAAVADYWDIASGCGLRLRFAPSEANCAGDRNLSSLDIATTCSATL